MAAHFDLEPYKAPLLFLSVAGVVVPLFRRLRVSPVLGFLIAGMLIGPHVLGRLDALLPFRLPVLANTENIAVVAAFGVVFLMFNIGLELSLERLVLLRRFVFGLGALQVPVTGGALYLSRGRWPRPSRRRSSPARRWLCPRPRSSCRFWPNSGGSPPLRPRHLFGPAVPGPAGGAAAVHGRHAVRPFAQASPLPAFAPALIAVAAIVGIGRLFAAASVPAGRRDPLDRAIHGGLPAGGDRDRRRGGGVRPVHGARRLHRRAAAGGNRFRRAIETAIDPFKGLLLGLFFVSIGASLDPLEVIAHPGRRSASLSCSLWSRRRWSRAWRAFSG